MSALRYVLTAPLAPAVDSIDALRARARALAEEFALPFDRAIATAVACDRVGFAFAAAYQAALHTLVPSIAVDAAVSLCVTEERGAHPRAIATRLVREDGALVLRGKKKWSTFAPAADALLVVASIGEDDRGRNRLALVRVDRHAPGVHVVPMPEPPFAPEIPHAETTLDVRVREEDVLEGDGYDRYVKPFRTIEDVHVIGALLAYVAGAARAYGWPRGIVEEIAAAIVGLRAIATSDPSAPEVHVALAGAFASMRAILAHAEPHWASVPADVRARWERDRPLLEVAGTARAKRLEAAWSALER
jgi:hypothetical protein